MANIYFGRLLTLDGADNFEQALQGKAVQIGSTVINDSLIVSNVTLRPNYAKFGNSNISRNLIEDNQKQTEAVNSYCMYADNLEEVVNNLLICASQPTSEDAISRIESGEYEPDDFFARDRVAMVLFSMPEEEFKHARELALIGTGEGVYEYEGGTETLPEAIVNDRVIRKAIHKGRILLFDEIHAGFEANDVSFDPEQLFDINYVPFNRINNLERLLESEEKSSDTNPYGSNTEAGKAWAQIMAMPDLSKEDKAMMLAALGDASKAKKMPTSTDESGLDEDEMDDEFEM